MKSKLPVLLSVAVMTVVACGDTITWTGLGEDGKWLTAGNWAGGIVPDADDTAVFSAVSEGAHTVIDLEGLEGIGNVTVTGADAPVFTFGTDSTQVLRMNGHGSKFLVEESVVNMPLLTCGFGLGNNVVSQMKTYIENNSAHVLHLNDYGYTSHEPGTVPTVYFCVAGTGNIQFDGLYRELSKIYANVQINLESQGELICNSEMDTMNRLVCLLVPSGVGSCRVRINKDARLYLSATSNALTASEDLDIYGEGTLQFRGGRSQASYWHGIVNVGSGRTLTIRTRLTAVKSSDAPAEAAIVANGAGVMKVLGTCDFAGTVINIGPGVIEVGDFGLKGEAWTLGTGDEIRIGNNGLFRYVGEGDDITDRHIVITNGITAPKTANGGLSHAGGGTFTVDSVVSQACEGCVLVLDNISDQLAVFRQAITDNPHSMGLKKTGTGRWDLSGANTYTGATSVEKGTLGLTGGTLKSPVTLKNGTTLEVAADKFTSQLSVSMGTGSAVLNVTGSGELVLSSLASSGGLLDIVFDNSVTSVRLDGQAAGDAPTWLTVNGEAAEFNSAGKIVHRMLVPDVAIAARGGVIPDDATKIVGITTSGSTGPITLENNASASVKTLVQKTSTPATVSLAGSLTLTADLISIAEDAAGLTIGSTAGEGFLSAPSGADVLEFENDSRAGDLTIAAGLSAAVPVGKTGEGTVRVTSVLPAGLELDIRDGTFAVSNSDTVLSAKLTGTGTFRKEGTGTCTFSVPQTGFQGDFVLAGGYNMLTANNMFGDATGALVITNGATLDMSSGLTVNAMGISFGNKEVRVSGTGCDGSGAIRFGKSGGLDNNEYTMYPINRMTLDGDTLIGMTNCYSGFQIGTSSSATPALVNMNGHSLTKLGGGNLRFINGSIINPGLIKIARDPAMTLSPNVSYSRLENDFDLGGDADGPPYVLGDSAVFIVRSALPQHRPLVCDGEPCTLEVFRAGNWSTNLSVWAGPVTLSNETTLAVKFSSTAPISDMFTFAGPISGDGGIVASNRGKLCLLDENNTFTGPLTINGVLGLSLYAAWPGSIPDPTKLTVDYGRVSVAVPNWTDADIADLAQKAVFNNGAVIALDTSGAENGEYAYAPGETFAEAAGFGKDGEGTLTVTGPIMSPAGFGVFDGTLKFTGDETITLGTGNIISDASLTDPEVVFDGASDVLLGEGKWLEVGGDGRGLTDSTGRLAFSDSCFRQAVLEPESGVMTGGIAVGRTGRGVMTVGEGACVTSFLYVGSAYRSSCGAVYQSGGEFVNWSTANTPPSIGYTGNGYYEISGGAYRQNGTVVRIGTGGWGVFHQKGGTVEHLVRSVDRVWIIGSRNMGVMTLSGGDLRCETDLYVCEATDSFGGGRGVLTVEGTADVTVEKSLIAASQPNGVAIVNLNGGMFASTGIRSSPKSGSEFYLNFDGGTCRVTSPNVQPDTVIKKTTRVTVFEGGAVIDVAAGNYKLSVPMEAPEGNGVLSVSADFLDGVDFIGSPIVEIIGSGSGASAFADFDSASGKITGIRVTSPGFGYADSGTKAVVNYGGVAYTGDTAVVTGPVSGGGFTKKGEGTLTLLATNTYAGATVVSEGVLELGCDFAIPSNTTVSVLAGATLDTNGKALENVSIGTAGGTVVGGFTMSSVWTVDMAEVASGNVPVFSDGVTFPDGMEIVFANCPENMAENSPYTLAHVPGGITGSLPDVSFLGPKWRIYAFGGKIRLRSARGSVISFR